MTKVSSIVLIFLAACSTHSDMGISEATVFKQENVAYSKIINYWVDGYYDGSGKNKKWIPGYWDKRAVNPALDPEYVWESGEWREVKNEK